MEKSGIYKITNLLNNKIYIGQAVNLQVRINTHKKYDTPERYNGSVSFENEKNMPIHKAIMKYHLNNFNIEILEHCSRNKLNEREQYWIQYYGSLFPNGYNLTKGGQGWQPKKGEESHLSKYTNIQVQKIKELLKQGLEPYKIYETYKEVHIDTIYAINQGKIWYSENEKYPLNDRKGKGLTLTEEENICKEYSSLYKEKGKMNTYKILGEKYNRSSRTIARIIKKYGL